MFVENPVLLYNLRMILSVVTIILLLITPSIVVKTLKRFKGLQFFGPVFYCYVLGIAFTNILSFCGTPISKELSHLITQIAQGFVLIAIVQMLLSTHFYELIKLSRVGLLGFSLAAFSVFFSCVIVFKTIPLIFSDLPLLDLKHLTSMAVGVYTGGTANMAVLSQTLKVNPQLFLEAYSSDLILSGILLMLLMNLIPWFFGLFLKKFDSTPFEENELSNTHLINETHLFPYPEIYQLSFKNIFLKSLVAVVVIILSLGVSFPIYYFFGLSLDQVALFTITTAGILVSCSGKISKSAQNDYFILGDYYLLIFCLSMGTLANLEKLQGLPSWVLLSLFFILLLSTLFHLLLCFLLKIDRDISIITLTASIFGPPFVICTAGALKNKHIITTGVTTGLIGMAVGTYLGLFFFNLF
jgi:uncharacterized membrane protein